MPALAGSSSWTTQIVASRPCSTATSRSRFRTSPAGLQTRAGPGRRASPPATPGSCSTATRRCHDRHMLAGVTIVNPAATVIDVGVEIGRDTVIAPFSSLHGATRIGERATVGPLSTLLDASIGTEASVVHSYVRGAEVGDRVSIGPFAYLRPGAVLREGAKAGTFVEIKNSEIGAGAKVPHLSYIGDTDVGQRANIGAGTITANYDGKNKHRTTIGAAA